MRFPWDRDVEREAIEYKVRGMGGDRLVRKLDTRFYGGIAGRRALHLQVVSKFDLRANLSESYAQQTLGKINQVGANLRIDDYGRASNESSDVFLEVG